MEGQQVAQQHTAPPEALQAVNNIQKLGALGVSCLPHAQTQAVTGNRASG
jgi:hypothetical protein